MEKADTQVPQVPSHTAAKILVIDDEAGLRQMLQFSLQKRGYEVSCAASGDEALALAAGTLLRRGHL